MVQDHFFHSQPDGQEISSPGEGEGGEGGGMCSLRMKYPSQIDPERLLHRVTELKRTEMRG